MKKKAFIVRVDEVLVYYTAKAIKQQNSEKTVENRIFKRWLLKFVIDWVVYVFLCTNDKLWYRAFLLARLANLLEQEKVFLKRERLNFHKTGLETDMAAI